jgi:NAD(P)-dependent dehydrogenase (short-subunit alcohol dehydrogenase family)
MQRTYVVTGSASGTGAATATLLRSLSHRVIGIDLVDADICADLSTPVGRLEATERSIELSEGHIDAIIACAGIAAPKPLTVSTNYFGTTQLVEGLLETLSHSAAPRVVVITSVAALRDHDDQLVTSLLAGREADAAKRGAELTSAGYTAGMLNYTSSKFALGQWVRREAVKPQWAKAGIALNAVAPGTVLTPSMLTLLQSDERRQLIDSEIPMPLHGHLAPADIASVLVWLASAENAHITGQTIFVDGGAEAIIRRDETF